MIFVFPGTGRGGMTPLHFAARAGSLEIACLLLDAGADPVRLNLRRHSYLRGHLGSVLGVCTLVANRNLHDEA